jgi:hypothetical protein
VTQTANILGRILRRRKETKLTIHMEKIRLDIKSKRMLIVISQRIFGTDEELCACLIDWQKGFDSLNGAD